MAKRTPTPEQVAAHERLTAAWREVTAAGDALLDLMPEDAKDEAIEATCSMLGDFRPHEVWDEMGPAYHADQAWDGWFEDDDAVPDA